MKKEIRIVFFTEKGESLAKRIEEALPSYSFTKHKKGKPILDFAKESFEAGEALIFIGAMGIAVRTIAPLVKDKLKDPPVIVIDELGQNVIPILSGHYGGANELAVEIAKGIKANPVITTATDINNAFSVDVFARENNLEINNKEGIAKVSTKALAGKPITISIKGYPPEEEVDVIISNDVDDFDKSKLGLKQSGSIEFVDSGIVVGIGCKKGKTFDELRSFLEEMVETLGRELTEITAIATIDIKEEEEGIKALSKVLSVPVLTFDSAILEKVEGEFSSSDFVKSITGVDNVCERAALATTFGKGDMILSKTSRDGMTLAMVELKKEKTIYVVGMGPGAHESMTKEAEDALNKADVIIGYTVYLDLLKDRYSHKEMLSTPMKQEVDRCRMCFDEANKGKTVAMVCSGDAGIYGMASIMYEISQEYDGEWNLEIVPGITAAISGAAVLGAPLNHDFAIISLSDLLTPWEKIERRLRAASEGDFAIAIYNPSSKKRKDYLKKACDILLENYEPERPCGYVKNIGREGTEYKICTLRELRDEEVDMFTTVFIGNSMTKVIDDKLVTPRGYRI